ncbi:glycosyltransferase [Luteimonas soli]|uniref:Glycosyltransferase n=1 Tax=Luteimonas soli TaxID=1648966 RepID=A0ABV7XPD9_9GAMM
MTVIKPTYRAGMDILLVSDVYFPRVNGVSTSIRVFARNLVRLGHRVTLVAPDYGEADAQRERDGEFGDGFRVLRLPARRIFFDPEDRLFTSAGLRGAFRQLATQHWDVVHVHTPFRAHRLGVKLGRALGMPVVETYHTYFEEYVAHYLPWLPSPLLRLAARALSRKLCHEVDHLIVPTDEMTQVLRGYGVHTPSTVLPTGVDLDEFAGGDGARFRAAHGIPPGQPMLVTVSRLAVEKNIPFLIDVAQRLLDRFPTLLLVIAGEGPDAARLRAKVAQAGLQANVRFVGNLDRRTALLDCYRAADAFVFASPTETQGLVLIEAMALGVPIVSTAVMGTATVLRGAHSALVSTEEVDAFAARVARVLDSPALRATLAAAGPRDAAAWGMDALLPRLMEVYALPARSGAGLPGVASRA